MLPQHRKWRWRWKRDLYGLLLLTLCVFSNTNALSQASFKFTQTAYNVSIPESPDGKAYAIPTIEADRMGIQGISDPTTEVRFRVVSGDKRKIFRPLPKVVGDFCFCILKPRTSTSSRLNRELEKYYDLTIEATVKGRPELVALTSINVTVLDRNDLNPLFYPTKYSVNIDEDVPLHSKILQVTASDADIGLNGDIYYVLNGPSSHFAVHPRTGVISAIKRPNVDAQKDFKISVVAQDRGPKSKVFGAGGTPSVAEVSVQVRRVNRNAPAITLQSLPAYFRKSHPDVVALLQVSDADNGEHGQIAKVETFEDSGNTNGSSKFFVTAGLSVSEYYLRAQNMNQLFASEDAQVTIKATDRGTPPKSSAKVVKVDLVPPNEFAPKIIMDQLTLDVSENLPVNSFVARVHAVDEDSGRNGRLTFSLVTETDLFRINNITGWIVLLRPLDREIRNVYELQVTVTDDALEGQRKSDTAKITMKIADENDNDPLFDHSEITVETGENEPAGTIVYTASARDADIGDNAVISYSMANLNEIPFEIDPETGHVKLTRSLDYEVDRREYRLKLRAADNGKPFRRETEMTLIIRLKGKNDNPPIFRNVDCVGQAVISPDSLLITLLADDADENDPVTYKMLNEEETIKKCFSLNESNGDVILKCQDLPSEKIALKFSATDGVFDAEKMLWVNLTMGQKDTNIVCQPNSQTALLRQNQAKSGENNARLDTFPHTPDFVQSNRKTPKFPLDFPAIMHVDEVSEVENQLVQLNAVDDDYGYNGLIRYAVTSDGDYFRVNPKGDLLVARTLDRETRLTHSVNITAEDCGNPPRSSSRLLLVKILDRNDNNILVEGSVSSKLNGFGKLPEAFSSKLRRGHLVTRSRPVFDSGCSFSIPENTPVGQTIGHVSASDKDEGLNGKIIYSIPSSRHPFTLHSESGAIIVSGRLDYETTPEHRFEIQAQDSATDSPRSSSLSCRVVVQDINDNAPTFPSSLIKVSVPEDLPVGSVLTFLKAFDQDSELNGQVEYGLVGESENDAVDQSDQMMEKKEKKTGNGLGKSELPFVVDVATGALVLTQPLDFEKVSVFNASVSAHDKGQPTLSSLAWVVIQVEDVDENLHAPRFKDFVLSASVLENQQPDTFVTQVKAVDEDGDKVEYSLVGGTGLHLFRMDSDGTIRSTVTFDRETQEHYWLKILAKDSALVPKFSVLHCHIRIGDVNDNNPMTPEPIYYTSVPESSPPDTLVARLEAFDLDSSSSALAYKITAGNPQGFFVINEKNGVIRTTNRKFDRETQAEHTLEVTISDSGEPLALSSTTFVVVTVQDVQDSAVAFYQQHLQRYIVPAWKPASTLPLFRIIAFDTDLGTNAEVRFSLVGKKTENERYRIDAETGEVFAVQPLKVGEDYNLVVKASDAEDSTPKKTLRIVVEASALPSAATKPPKVAPTVETDVLESEAVGHTVVVLEAEDPDGDMLWYYIVGAVSASPEIVLEDVEHGDPKKQFHIGPHTGNLIITRPLDWETVSSYSLKINVTDGVHFVPTTIHVKVKDVNEHRPSFLKRSFIASVPENAPPGTEVVTVSASDIDEEQRLIYSIYSTGSPASNSKFKIDEGTGVINTAAPLDRETTAQHAVIVLVKDRGTNSRGDLAKVLINVIDLNDHAPVFRDIPQPVIIPHGTSPGHTVMTAEAFDRDTGLNAEIIYRLTAFSSLFEIDSVTGVVKLLQSSEKVGSDEIAVKIEATDKGVPPMKSESVVLIKFEDGLGGKQASGDTEMIASVAENLPAGSFVTVITVDVPAFGEFQLSDRGSGDKNAFSIDSSSGIITTAALLDYEKQRVYTLNVLAVSLTETRTIPLTVYVTDVNDNPPRLNFTSIVGRISESSSIGSAAQDGSGRPVIVAAFDEDSGVSKLLTFEMLDPEAAAHFEVLSTGSIRLRGMIDYEKRRQYHFRVQVSDYGPTSLKSLDATVVTIDVINVNDCSPVFDHKESNFTVTVPAYPGLLVGVLKATDADDVNQTTPLSYKIAAGNSDKLFSIDSNSGALRLIAPVAKQAENPLLTVQVSDGLHTSTTRVSVTFSDANSNGLRFVKSVYQISVDENSPVGKPLLHLGLTGRFLGEDAHFALLTEHPSFMVDADAGILFTTNTSLDREKMENFTLVVEAVAASAQSRRVARAQIMVNVTDVNDNAPEFLDSPYVISVPVYGRKGLLVEKVESHDADEGINAKTAYNLESGDPALITIDNAGGQVSLSSDLSEEHLGKEFSYLVRGTDGGNPPLSSVTSLVLRIVSDYPAVFTKSRYSANVSENAEIGSAVVQVNATYEHADQKERKVVYAIMDGDPFNSFEMDFSTGMVRLAEPLDYEIQKSYILRIRAMDPWKWETLYSDVELVVHVMDQNDNAPKFKDGSTFYSVKVSESTLSRTEIFQVTATDADSEENAQLYYTLQWSDDAAREAYNRIRNRKADEDVFHRCGIRKGPSSLDEFKAGDYFQIDAVSGEVYLINELDREMIDQLDLTIIVSDSGHPRQSAAMTLRVAVKDINDNAPCFTDLSYDFVAGDKIRPGKFVGAVAAIDHDEAAEVEYEIVSGNENGFFAIDKQGIVTFSPIARGFLRSISVLNITATDGVHVSQAQINILPMATNRQRPKFDWPRYSLSAPENSSPGTVFGSVRATDEDPGLNGKLRYSIVGEQYESLFSVDSATGTLLVTGLLDRERQEDYLFWVQVTDMGGLTDFCQVNLTVTDMNDEEPVFTRKLFSATVFMNASVDSVLLRVEATDADAKENASIIYSINTEYSKFPHLFYIDSRSGVLKLKKALKAGVENKVLSLIIEAVDEGTPPLRSSVPVELLVTSEQSELPEFEQQLNHISVHESSPVNTTLMQVKMKLAQPVNFTLIPPAFVNETYPFTIHPDGRIVVTGSLDFEKQNEYRFFVSASYLSNPLVINHAELRVRIVDGNDNAPVFVADKFVVQAPENHDGVLRLMPILATDADFGVNAEVTYGLVNSDQSQFSVDANSGWLVLSQKLDREAESRHVLLVTAVDGGLPAHTSTATVEVQVIDVNDNPPRFPQETYQTSVKEEKIPDIPVVVLHAVDPDETSTLEYYIVKGDPFHHFTINSRGEMYVLAPLDREKESSYELTVMVTDGLESGSTKLRVSVLDVNDNTPLCSKTYFHEIVPEDVDTGHVILRMQATDADQEDDIEYSVVGERSDAFTMDRASGILRVKSTLDRETNDQFQLLGIAADRDGRSCTASIEIVVTDANDNAPSFPQNLTIAVSEDTPTNTLLHRLRALDHDLGSNRVVRYSFLSSDQENPVNVHLFSVNETSGFIVLKGQVDREEAAKYELKVRAKDSGQPQLWSMANIKIFVQNVRDDPPKFSLQQYQFSVAENAATGSEIGRVDATSLDDAVQGDLTYYVTDGNQLGVFEVDPRTGKITVRKALDFEKQPEYILFLEARDSSEPPLIGYAQVLVHVADVNDNAPVFSQSVYSAKLPEDSSFGSQVIQVSASDIDKAENGYVTYEFSDPKETSVFALDRTTGWIAVIGSLDREEVPLYSLKVIAVDSGVPALTASATVEISLSDVNDSPPVFEKTNYTAVLQVAREFQEKRAGGFTILKFYLTDPDTEINGPPFGLEITSGNEEGYFQVAPSDLTLRTTRPLDDRKNSEFSLKVTARDNGQPSLNSTATVTIKIVAESQFPPKIVPVHISVLSADGKYGGGTIGKITASDPDIYDILRYEIVSPELKGAFETDALQGTLFAKAGVPPGSYDVNVSVTDGRFTSYEKIAVIFAEVDKEMLENSVSIQLDDVSVEEFINTYRRDFVRALRQVFALRRNKDVHIISIQPAELDADNEVEERRKREITESIQVLFAVSKGKNDNEFISTEELQRTLEAQKTTLQNLMDLKGVRISSKNCTPESCVAGECKEKLELLDQWKAPYVSVVGSSGQSFVYPRHRRTRVCVCRSGYGGDRCDKLVNDCVSRQCDPPKVCVAVGKSETRCVCGNGKEGTKCDQPSSEDTDADAVTFSGNSYAWYDLQKPIERHLSLTMKFKTRFGVGNLMYVAGRLDYSILEIKNGVVQYRFDCGSGEGLAKLEGVFVSDNHWHELSVQRHGRQAEIRLDGKYTAHATAPGINDILNLEGNDAFFGAEVPGRFSAASSQRSSLENVLRDVRRGFIGCMKHIMLNGVELPSTGRNPEATVVQLANIQRGCHITQGELGPCASMPCQNGATCEPNSETAFICKCPTRFYGTLCENDSNPCGSHPCLHGTCTNRAPNDFHCSCPPGLTGKRCEYGRYCNPNPCRNGGCEEGTLGPICQCLHGFDGQFCERDVNECLQSPCQNGAACENFPGNFRCNCSVQFRGTLCEESIYIPNIAARGLGASWTWVEILVVAAIVAFITVTGVLCVICRKKFRKRRATGIESQRSQDSTASPSNNTINNDICRANKLCNNRVAAEDTLLKRGSKISNLEVEARQPMLYNEHGPGGSVGRSSTRPRQFRPLTPPPPSCSATSSETMSVNRKSNLFDGDERDTKQDVKGFVVDLATPNKSMSVNEFRRGPISDVSGRKESNSSSLPRNHRSSNSSALSQGTSPMDSDNETHAVSPVAGNGKELSWDNTGIALQGGDTSVSTTTAPVTPSGRSPQLPIDDSDEWNDLSDYDDRDYAENSPFIATPLQPPQQFQDFGSIKRQRSAEDYFPHSTINKRFSDYIPAADVEYPPSLSNSRETTIAKNKGERPEEYRKVEEKTYDIPPPMPTLEGYPFSKKRGTDGKNLRPFVSTDGLSPRETNGKMPGDETVSLLNGGEIDDYLEDFRKDTISPVEWNAKPEGKQFSAALGKQTQV